MRCFLLMCAVLLLISGCSQGKKKVETGANFDAISSLVYPESVRYIKGCMDRGKYDEALDLINLSIRKFPDKPTLYRMRAETNVFLAGLRKSAWKTSDGQLLKSIRYDIDKAIELGGGEEERLMLAEFISYNSIKPDDWRNVIKESKQVLKENPNSYHANLVTAYAYNELGDADESLRYYDRTIKIDPEKAIAYSLKASVYLNKKDNYREAKKLYLKAYSLDKKDVSSTYFIANDKFKLAQDFPGCLKMLEETQKNFPRSDFFTRDRFVTPVSLYSSLAEVSMANYEFEKSLQYYDKAIESASMFEGIKAALYEEKGELLYRMGRIRDARENFTRCLKLLDKIIEKKIFPLPEYDLYIARGKCYEYTGNFELAVQAYEKAATKAEELPKEIIFSNYYISRTYLKMGKNEDSFKLAKNLEAQLNTLFGVKNFAKAECAFGDVGIIRTACRKYAAALPKLSIVLEKEPGNPDLRFFRGLANFHLKKFKNSTEDLEKVIDSKASEILVKQAEKIIESMKNKADTSGVSFYLSRARANTEKAGLLRDDRSIENRKILELIKSDLDNAIRLGGGENAYLMRSNYHEFVRESDLALLDAEKALSLNPDSFRANISIGVIHLNTNGPAEAMKCFDRAIKIEPGNSIGYSLKGFVLASKFNNGDEAEKYYDKALSLNGDDIYALLNKSIRLVDVICDPGEKKIDAKKYNLMALKLQLKAEGIYLNKMSRNDFDIAYRNINPKTIYHDLSDSYLRLDNYPKCIEYLDKAIQMEKSGTKKAMLKADKGYLLSKIGKYEDARKSFLDVMKLEPENLKNDPAVIPSDFYQFKGWYYELIGRNDKAIEIFKFRKKLTPKEVDNDFQIAKNLAKMGKYGESMEHVKGLESGFKKKYGTDNVKDSVFLAGYVGIIRSLSGEYGDSIEPLSQAIKIQPENMDFRLFRGISYFHLKKFKESEKDLEKAFKSDADEPTKRQAGHFLASIQQRK